MGSHISDTRTMRWGIYYTQSRSGRTLSVDTLRQTVADSCIAAVCSGKIMWSDIDRIDIQTDSEIVDCCLAAPANIYLSLLEFCGELC